MLKYPIICLLIFFSTVVGAQSLQLHYDLRHTINPNLNGKNYPTLYFEYYKTLDSGRAFVKFGSFLLKTQADFVGGKSNIGKYFMQVSQEIRCWQPALFLNLQYSGGLGITEPRQYSYYIVNTFSAGVSYHYKIGNAFLSSVLFYKYVPYVKPSNDFLFTTYFYRGLWNYKADVEGDFSVWTENKDHGDGASPAVQGKRFFFFAQPQFWYNLKTGFSFGTKINTYYHLNASEAFEIYPTVAIRYKFK